MEQGGRDDARGGRGPRGRAQAERGGRAEACEGRGPRGRAQAERGGRAEARGDGAWRAGRLVTGGQSERAETRSCARDRLAALGGGAGDPPLGGRAAVRCLSRRGSATRMHGKSYRWGDVQWRGTVSREMPGGTGGGQDGAEPAAAGTRLGPSAAASQRRAGADQAATGDGRRREGVGPAAG